ncbi:MAG: exodeoxyribonuclease small subunit [Candidatus Methanomethylophilaceae archaeon]|nr:exodeoxyribonuclease small subunit [Candidatus Methanomethylophilaceae archaeon]MDI3542196.1 exodeoxyribonuclease small subunit [Candidatus Methanomethylophilaceae archaeon]
MNEESEEGLSFEKAMSKLEELVTKLDEGDLGLEESLSIYEEAVKLRDFCRKRLEEYERRVRKLVDKDGELTLENFD